MVVGGMYGYLYIPMIRTTASKRMNATGRFAHAHGLPLSKEPRRTNDFIMAITVIGTHTLGYMYVSGYLSSFRPNTSPWSRTRSMLD